MRFAVAAAVAALSVFIMLAGDTGQRYRHDLLLASCDGDGHCTIRTLTSTPDNREGPVEVDKTAQVSPSVARARCKSAIQLV